MVGQWSLTPYVGVRLPRPQPIQNPRKGVFYWLGFRGTRSPTGVRKQMPGAFAKHLSVAKMARRARLKEEPSTPESIKWNEDDPKGEVQEVSSTPESN